MSFMYDVLRNMIGMLLKCFSLKLITMQYSLCIFRVFTGIALFTPNFGIIGLSMKGFFLSSTSVFKSKLLFRIYL